MPFSIRFPFFLSSISLSSSFGTIPHFLVIIGFTVSLMFHLIFSYLARSKHRSLLSFSLIFTLWKSTIQLDPFLLVIVTWYDNLGKITWPVCISKTEWILCVLFPRTDSCLYVYHLVVWSNFRITFPTSSCLLLQSFWASSLHFLTMCFLLSFRPCHQITSTWSSILTLK